MVVLLSLPPPPGQRGMERINAVVQGLVLRRMKSDLGINGKELVSVACAARPSPTWGSRFVWDQRLIRGDLRMGLKRTQVALLLLQ